MKKQKVIIAGGGIAGLTCAIALQKKGFDTEVFEAAPSIGPVGAGVVIGANALKALQLLGLDEEVKAAGRKMTAARIIDQKGKTILNTPEMVIDGRIRVFSFTIHRAALHKILLDHCHGLSHTNRRAVSVKQDDKGITLFFDDGSSVEGDFLVVADGIHSAIRTQLMPEAHERYSGFTCWRGVTNHLPASVQDDLFTETWGVKGRFGIVPIGDNKVYWYATARFPRNATAPRAMKTAELKKHYDGYHAAVHELISATDDSKIICSDLIDLEPINRFNFGRVVLVGDAAHATTPNLGQGACQAIEDALFLSSFLAENPTPAGLEKFSRVRIPRTTKVVDQSWKLGKLSETSSSFWAGLRNGILRMSPASLAKRQYRFLFDIRFEGWE